MNIFATAAALSDQALLDRLDFLAGKEREASVDLVAHLAALDARPAAYAAQGYGSLFAYCTQALRLSEDATCNRIEAARVCRRFPVILDLLASGAMSLTSVRLLGRHLTAENHQAVLARANGRSRREIESLIAELAPRPDVPTSVRMVPTTVMTSPRRRWYRPRLSPPSRLSCPPEPSVLGRIRASPRATFPARSSAPSRAVTAASAPSSLPTAGGARSGRSWSSTTSSPRRSAGRPPPPTSRCAAGGTTSTRPSWSSGRIAPRA